MAGWNEFADKNPQFVGAADGAAGSAAGSASAAGVSPAGALMRVEAWSDGSSRGNPGPGGYGAVLRYVDPAGVSHEREFSAGYARTTNNRMELMGAIAALEALRRPCRVDMTTDSQYVCNAFNQHWIAGWQRRGWKTASKQPVKNVDLWQRLIAACEPHDVHWHWVKGHAGHAENERCDALATAAADGKTGALLADAGFEG